MKHIKGLSLILCLLVLLTAVLASCDSKDPAADTTASQTDAPTEAPKNPTDETPTEAPTEAPTDAETDPPAELTADELKTLLSAALAKDTENTAVTIKATMDGEPYVNQTVVQMGNDFAMIMDAMGMKTTLTVLGEKAYYFISIDDGESVTELRYVLTPTAEERTELLETMISEGASTGLEDDDVAKGLLNSTMTGKKYADGTVELSCTELDPALVTILMGEPMEGAVLSFDFTLDTEGRMSFMRFTIDLPAELTGGEGVTVTTETVVDYTPDAITAPADADQYAPATYDDLFGITLPEADPELAAALGLALDGNNYTVGAKDSAVDLSEQYMFLYVHAHYYGDKTFTLYGNITENEQGDLVFSLGEDMDIPLYFDGVSSPARGSYVKLTATYTQTVDMGEYMDFDCFTMMVTACEVLGEAQGPNGGKIMFITASSLNVRSSPDSSVGDNKVGLLYEGDEVEVLETGLGSNGNWCKIIFDCDAGYAYISMTYVSDQKP